MTTNTRLVAGRSPGFGKSRRGLTSLETVAIVAIGCIFASGVVKLGKKVTGWCGGQVAGLTGGGATLDTLADHSEHPPVQPTVHTVHPNKALVDDLQNNINNINTDIQKDKTMTPNKNSYPSTGPL